MIRFAFVIGITAIAATLSAGQISATPKIKTPGAAQDVVVAENTAAVENLVWDLKSILKDGRHRTLPIAQLDKNTDKNNLGWVKAYVEAAHDPRLAADFSYVQGASAIMGDKAVAGTLSAAAWKGLVAETLQHSLEYPEPSNEPLKANIQENLEQALLELQRLHAAGAMIAGFDGFMQSGCAAPTLFLLVYLPSEAMVHGIDLKPCSEG